MQSVTTRMYSSHALLLLLIVHVEWYSIHCTNGGILACALLLNRVIIFNIITFV